MANPTSETPSGAWLATPCRLHFSAIYLTFHQLIDDTVNRLRVPPVVPFDRSPYPASPSLQWIPEAIVLHLLNQLNSLRYYDPLRLPKALLMVVRFSLSGHNTLIALLLSCFPDRNSLEGLGLPPQVPGVSLTQVTPYLI